MRVTETDEKAYLMKYRGNIKNMLEVVGSCSLLLNQFPYLGIQCRVTAFFCMVCVLYKVVPLF